MKKIREWVIVLFSKYLTFERLLELVWYCFSDDIRYCAIKAVKKVQIDEGLQAAEGSNLGRNIRRDEASEWSKLYMKDRGVEYRDSDMHLACEIAYFLFTR